MIGTDSKSFGSNRSTLKEVVQELDEISICQGHYSSSSILNDSKLFLFYAVRSTVRTTLRYSTVFSIKTSFIGKKGNFSGTPFLE